MNHDYFFLENFYLLLRNGYSIQQVLEICYSIEPHKEIINIQDLLLEGYSVEDAIQKSHLPPVFKEYFHFFQKKNNLSQAIENSLNICKMQNSYVKKIQKELSYPCMLLLFLFFFSIFVVFILMPEVNNLFFSFGISLSFILKIIIYLFQIIPVLFIILIILLIILMTHLINGLRNKRFKIIESYLDSPIVNNLLKKYFSLKFSIYYNELLKEHLDTITIIDMLNKQLIDTDIKIILYEIQERMFKGELIEDILNDFIYFDELLLVFFRMILQHHNQLGLQNYIDITFVQMELTIKKFMKVFTSFIYVFVALFVIVIYVSIIIPMMNVIGEI